MNRINQTLLFIGFLILMLFNTDSINAQNTMPLAKKTLYSHLEIYDINSNTREIIFEDSIHLEAPNWSPSGDYLLFNSEGNIYKFDLKSKTKTKIPLDFAQRCNNDHGISSDGKTLVISHNDNENIPPEEHKFGTSKIYTVSINGGKPKEITPKAPSYWHGISPDGQELAYVARRNGQYDIYTIDINGGEEHQITSSPDLDDGPDYSPDGKYIYYNSFDSGSMEIWRMNTDGSEKKQLTNDKHSNWFAHPNPNSKNFVYISYEEDQGQAHPALKNVSLKLYDLETKAINTLCHFTGGQGTINVPSWSPDGSKFAFVSYKEK